MLFITWPSVLTVKKNTTHTDMVLYHCIVNNRLQCVINGHQSFFSFYSYYSYYYYSVACLSCNSTVFTVISYYQVISSSLVCDKSH